MLFPAGPTISALRLAEDYANAVDCILQQTPYHVFITTIKNDFIGLESIGNVNPIRTDLRITIADGYRAYLANQGNDDGYLYPQIIEQTTQVLFASEGALTSDTLLLGPLVFPYSLGVKTGGTDPAIFQQSIGNPINNIQYWIWLIGPGLVNSQQGNYYDIKEIKIDAMNNINYYLVLEATSKIPTIALANVIN